LEANIYFSRVDFVEDASDVGSSISDKSDKEDDPTGGALTFGLGIAGAATALPIFPTIFSSSSFSFAVLCVRQCTERLPSTKTLGFVSGFGSMFAGLGCEAFRLLELRTGGEGIVVDATSVASAGIDVSDGSIAPATEDRLHLAIVINSDPNREYRTQEKVALGPNGILN
jgi:hypothetical protein